MIVILEHDRRFGFWWRPRRYRYWFNGAHSMRVIWGWWSVSWYQSPGLMEFFEYLKEGNTEWHDE